MGKDKHYNPADVERKRAQKAFKTKTKKKEEALRETRELLMDPGKIQAQIDSVQAESNNNRLDKSLKEKLVELKKMKDVALRNVKRESNKAGGASSSNQHGAQGRNQQNQHHQQRQFPMHQQVAPVMMTMRPEDSVYYHPQFNPSGMPPPGRPLMYRPGAVPVVQQQEQQSSYGPGTTGLHTGGPPPPPSRAFTDESRNRNGGTKRKFELNNNNNNNNNKFEKRKFDNKREVADPLDPSQAKYNDDLEKRQKKELAFFTKKQQEQEEEETRKNYEAMLAHQQYEASQQAIRQKQYEEYMQMTQSNMPLKKLKQLQEQMAAQSAQQSLMAPSQVSSNKEDDEEDILADAEEEEELGADVSARLAALRKSFVSDGVEEKTEKEVVDVDDASSEEEEDNSNDDAQEVEKKKDEESDDEEEEEDVGLQARVDSLKARIASAIGKSSQESATIKAAAPSTSGLNALAGYSDSDSDNEEEDEEEEEKAHPPAAADPAIASFFNEIKEIS